MGFWEPRTINPATVAALGNTAVYNLPEAGLLTGLQVDISVATVKDVTNTIDDWRAIDNFSKVEVLHDGNKPVKSLTGQLAQAINFYDTGVSPLDALREYSTNTQFARFFLPMGRYPFDMEYGYDLSRHQSATLELTNVMTSTYWGTPALTVTGWYWNNLKGGVSPAFKGYIRSEIWRKYTSVQAATEEIRFPTEGLLRRAIIQSQPNKSSGVQTTSPWNVAYDLLYKANSGDDVLYDNRLQRLGHMNAFDYGIPLLVGGQTYRVSAEDVDTGVAEFYQGGALIATRDGAISTTVPTIDDSNGSTFTTYTPLGPMMWMFKGVGLHKTAVLRHDHMPHGEDFLDLAMNRQVQLNITTRDASTAADGTVRVVTERVE